ncbi:MAG: FxsA family protein [Planctomycetaceae bacterium]|nr:FxsA family protein [Planctomycetaceae bacterium]
MFGRFLLFLILVPLVELALLHQLYQKTDLLTTVVVVLATGIIGLNLARRQGMHAWKAIHLATAAGKTPSREILEGVMILLAGAFLITPGLLTDGVGFAFLIPQVRSSLGVRLTAWFKAKTVSTFQARVWPDSADGSAGSGPFGDAAHPFADAPPTDAADEGPSVRVVPPTEVEHRDRSSDEPGSD